MLAAFILAWVVLHISRDANGTAIYLSFPNAAFRSEQQMEVPKPVGHIRVNTADEKELRNLSGVGRVVAEAMIAEREQGGAFFYPEDLLNVRGIGEKRLAGMLEQISLE